MLMRSERVAFEERQDAPSPRHNVLALEPDATYPTAKEVFREIGATIAVFLVIALAVNLLLQVLGL